MVTLYLVPGANLQLRAKLREQLRPGARVISRSFDMGDWLPEVSIEARGERIYRWTVT